jgi:hypothetical protein
MLVANTSADQLESYTKQVNSHVFSRGGPNNDILLSSKIHRYGAADFIEHWRLHGIVSGILPHDSGGPLAYSVRSADLCGSIDLATSPLGVNRKGRRIGGGHV